MLRVRKLHCTFDKSYCVVSVQIQQMLDLYKSCWLPLLATSLYSSDIYQTLPCAKFERGMETNSSARQALIIAVSKWESEVSILSAPFLQSHPLFLFYYSSLERQVCSRGRETSGQKAAAQMDSCACGLHQGDQKTSFCPAFWHHSPFFEALFSTKAGERNVFFSNGNKFLYITNQQIYIEGFYRATRIRAAIYRIKETKRKGRTGTRRIRT